ncbi:EspA/EspE family type VII secretion system effector [Mycobacterium syngnathidarum]
MSALDGFYSTWNKARETFGVGTPTDGSQHDGSSQLLKMKGMVESAAQHDGWQGKGAEAYAAANQQHAAVYGKLAELDKKMSAEITNAANIVTNGRTQLDNTKSWVDSAVNSLPSSLSAQAREKSLIPIAKEGITQVNNTVSTANGDMLKIGFRITDIKNQYDELQNQKFGPGDALEVAGDKPDEKKRDTQLDSENGRTDAEALQNGAGRLLAPEYHDRLLDAGTLSEQQLADLASGKDVVVGADRMAYLYQLSQGLNGMSPEEVKAMSASLPPDEQKALAQGLAIISNHHALSGIPNSEGVTDATRDNFIPAAGSLINLPDGIHEELSRTDRVVVQSGHTVGTGTMFPTHVPESTQLNGVGALQDISDVFKPGDGAYFNGSEATKSMLDASSQYANADAKHNGTFGDALSRPSLNSDHHGANLPGALADVIQVSGNDHVGMHDLSTNPSTRDNFLHGLTAERWNEYSSQVGDAFRWMGSDPHNPISAETANSVAHYLSDSADDHLRHMPGGGFFGEVNGGLLQAMADGTSPYLAQLAGAGPQSGFASPGIDGFNRASDMSALFSVFDQDHTAGTVANNAALQQKFFLEVNAAEHGDVPGNSIEVASRLGEAMANGALDAKNAGIANNVWELHEDNQKAGVMFDTFYGGLTAVEGLVPGGQIPAAAQTVLGPMFKDQLLPETDPTTVHGDDFFTNQLSDNRFSNTTSNYAVALQGLINSHPEIAHDEALKDFIKDGRVDLYTITNQSLNANSTLSNWFEQNGAHYGYNQSTWTTQRQDGIMNDNWSY